MKEYIRLFDSEVDWETAIQNNEITDNDLIYIKSNNKVIYNRSSVSSIKPSSHGSYFKTDYYTNDQTKIIIHLKTGPDLQFGCTIGNQNYSVWFQGDQGGKALIGNGHNQVYYNITPNTEYVVSVGAVTGIYINDIKLKDGIESQDTTRSSYPLWVFVQNRSGRVYGYYDYTIKSIEIYEGDNLMRKYLPKIDNNKRYGMQETVFNKFYKSLSTIPFVLGDC